LSLKSKKTKRELPVQAHSQAGAWEREDAWRGWLIPRQWDNKRTLYPIRAYPRKSAASSFFSSYRRYASIYSAKHSKITINIERVVTVTQNDTFLI
jgi:hypothetical protein